MADQKNPKRRNLELLFQHVENGREWHAIRGLGSGLSPEQYRLCHWQIQRLLATYSDLMKSPRYRPAIEFFFEDLYGARDFSRRDYDAARLTTIMARVLPARSVYTAALAMELNALSHELDHCLLQVLGEELGVREQITAEVYIEAYRRCDNYGKRRRQIELIKEIGDDIDATVAKHARSIITALHLTRLPSQLVGLGELHHFLERGYIAFRQMEGGQYFLETVLERELEILNRIYDRHPNPFQVEIPA